MKYLQVVLCLFAVLAAVNAVDIGRVLDAGIHRLASRVTGGRPPGVYGNPAMAYPPMRPYPYRMNPAMAYPPMGPVHPGNPMMMGPMY